MVWRKKSMCDSCKNNFTGFCLEFNDSVNAMSIVADRNGYNTCNKYMAFDENQTIQDRIKERSQYNLQKLKGEGFNE